MDYGDSCRRFSACPSSQQSLGLPRATLGWPTSARNDGGILLADVVRLSGSVYPVWGADHYLHPAWDMRPLLKRLLHEAASPYAYPLQAGV